MPAIETGINNLSKQRGPTPMATLAQLEANRENALKSTGPRTVDGKAKSRRNAFKHGLAANDVSFIDAEAVERRDDWGQDYRTVDREAGFAFDRLVAASIRIERCEAAIDGIFASDPERARLCWDADKRAECAATFARLEKTPGAVVADLKGSLHGVGLLVETWELLGESLTNGASWTEAEESLALDLLGVPPACRDGRTPIDGPHGGDRDEHRRAIVRAQVDKLNATVEEVGELDLMDRKLAMAGLATLTSKKAQLVLRYEREAWRRYREARKALAPYKIAAEERVAPRPAPVPSLTRGEAPPVAARPASRGLSGASTQGERNPILTREMPKSLVEFAMSDLDISCMPMNFTVTTPRRRV